MKPALALVALLAVGSCVADKRSTSYTCQAQTDCKDGRICQMGFCVVDGSMIDGGNGCPLECTSCNLPAKTCEIDCSTSSTSTAGCVSPVVCPTGFACTISCSADNACPIVDCSAAASCDLTCSAKMACGEVNCGTGKCDVTCSGINACGLVSCSDACKCDVSCANGGNSCGSNACPTSSGGNCFDNAPGFPCDSSLAGCNTCGP